MVSFLTKLIGILVLVVPVVFGAPALGQSRHLKIRDTNPASVIPNKFIVVFKKNITATVISNHITTIERLLSKRKRDFSEGGISANYSFGDFKGYAITANQATIFEVAAAKEVAYIEPDAIVRASEIRQEVKRAERKDSWNLGRISHRNPGIPGYVGDNIMGFGVTIFVIDTGVRVSHHEFSGRATWGANFIDSSDTDKSGHGTHVAGIAAGINVGVAARANIVAVKVLDDEGFGTLSSIINGLSWVVSHRTTMSVANLSFGTNETSTALNQAVRSMISEGITTIVAAGNLNINANETSPASEVLAITVGAIDDRDTRATFSNYGSVIDIWAPGVDINSTSNLGDDLFRSESGTSMATPHVSGIAACFMASEGLTSPADVQDRMKTLATKVKVVNAIDSDAGIAYNGSNA